MSSKSKKLDLNIIAKTALYLFYFIGLLVVLCSVMPWSTSWALIEIPMLFVPRWWPILLLLPTVIINSRLAFVQWKKIALTLIVITFFYLDFQLPNNYFSTKPVGQALNIMSVNLGGEIKLPKLIKDKIMNDQLVIIAFQETPKIEAQKVVPEGWDLHCIGQMCLASAYKVEYINSQSRKILGGWGQLGLLYQLQIKEQKVYIMNLHLETPRKGLEGFQLSKMNFDVIFKNAEQRYLESSIISSWVKDKSPTIILGDFNMPIESSIYRERFSDYQNVFNEAGFGFGYTKNTRLLGVRIDHILVDENFSVVETEIGGDVGSDHSPILATLVLNKVL
ncbi:MAG: endonuclease/exonuclease/phosphatase family protein [Colwellia sp.]|nr:endonuclease/exonuclease/phosphatase family protein [Colwellia sp.]